MGERLVVDVPRLESNAKDAVTTLVNWTYYQQTVLALCKHELEQLEQTPDIRNLVARIDLAAEGKEPTP